MDESGTEKRTLDGNHLQQIKDFVENNCQNPVQTIVDLFQSPNIKLVVLGDLHGTPECESLYVDIVKSLPDDVPLSICVETPRIYQSLIDKFTAGEVSLSQLREEMIDTCRLIEIAKSRGIPFICVGSPVVDGKHTPIGDSREKDMADGVIDALKKRKVLAILGNSHLFNGEMVDITGQPIKSSINLKTGRPDLSAGAHLRNNLPGQSVFIITERERMKKGDWDTGSGAPSSLQKALGDYARERVYVPIRGSPFENDPIEGVLFPTIHAFTFTNLGEGVIWLPLSKETLDLLDRGSSL